MPLRFDTNRWPFVDVYFDGKLTAEEFAAYVERLEETLDRRARYVMLTDAGSSLGIPAKARADMGAFIQRRRSTFDAFQLGHAVLVRSPLQRGIVTALNWLTPMPGNVRAFPDRGEAAAWLKARWDESVGTPLDIT